MWVDGVCSSCLLWWRVLLAMLLGGCRVLLLQITLGGAGQPAQIPHAIFRPSGILASPARAPAAATCLALPDQLIFEECDHSLGKLFSCVFL